MSVSPPTGLCTVRRPLVLCHLQRRAGLPVPAATPSGRSHTRCEAAKLFLLSRLSLFPGACLSSPQRRTVPRCAGRAAAFRSQPQTASSRPRPCLIHCPRIRWYHELFKRPEGRVAGRPLRHVTSAVPLAPLVALARPAVWLIAPARNCTHPLTIHGRNNSSCSCYDICVSRLPTRFVCEDASQDALDVVQHQALHNPLSMPTSRHYVPSREAYMAPTICSHSLHITLCPFPAYFFPNVLHHPQHTCLQPSTPPIK